MVKTNHLPYKRFSQPRFSIVPLRGSGGAEVDRGSRYKGF